MPTPPQFDSQLVEPFESLGPGGGGGVLDNLGPQLDTPDPLDFTGRKIIPKGKAKASMDLLRQLSTIRTTERGERVEGPPIKQEMPAWFKVARGIDIPGRTVRSAILAALGKGKFGRDVWLPPEEGNIVGGSSGWDIMEKVFGFKDDPGEVDNSRVEQTEVSELENKTRQWIR